MNANEQLITRFYTAFQTKDYKTMQDSYSDKAVFTDSVFTNLNSAQIKAMWEMLLKASTDMNLEFKNVKADDKTGSAEWIAHYTFSRTGNKVVNKIKAGFVFEDGKILQHKDHFDFYTWARQALGFSGLLLGWTGFMKNKIQTTAMGNLNKFMS
jgi:ketosteroid isomerase-like protein